ncbi:MAG: endonuclease/exonuclease/phosphatase family protein [Actinomycetota bacterium]
MSDPLRVVSWNIRFGVEVDAAVDELVRVDELVHPDLLLLQEMDEDGSERIASALGARFVYWSVAAHRKSDRPFGNAIVSPWPITEWAAVELPHVAPVSGHPRAAVRARLRIHERDVVAYSVHTETAALRLARRIDQFQRIADDVRDQGVANVIVGGDFNTVTARGVSALVGVFASSGLDRAGATAGGSFRRAGRTISLDHLFVAGFETSNAGVVSSTAASDHLPLWAELRMLDR